MRTRVSSALSFCLLAGLAVPLAAQEKSEVAGNTAVVTGAYHERGNSDGKPYEYHDRLTDVWMKTGGRWQVIASHYSVPVK